MWLYRRGFYCMAVINTYVHVFSIKSIISASNVSPKNYSRQIHTHFSCNNITDLFTVTTDY